MVAIRTLKQGNCVLKRLIRLVWEGVSIKAQN